MPSGREMPDQCYRQHMYASVNIATIIRFDGLRRPSQLRLAGHAGGRTRDSVRFREVQSTLSSRREVHGDVLCRYRPPRRAARGYPGWGEHFIVCYVVGS